jgi:hypothetical protein
MATQEKETLRLDGALAYVARELGIGVWDEETQSITVEASRLAETRALLDAIAEERS